MEELFNVTVLFVNIYRVFCKTRRIGQYQGFRPRYKRVIITLKPEDSIPLFPEA
jgi:large subunit ribosomal protein L23